jgi:hypothetical protein
MPTIDTDLFQVLVLALLFLCLLALLAALSVLNGLKRMSGSTPVQQPQAAAATQSSYDYQPATTSSYEPAYSAPVQQEVKPAEVQPTQEVSTGFVSITEAVPVAAATTASQTSGLTGSEPEEQPFERDGRWWFKRGGELLVYDEGTGQWVAAPAGAGAGAVTTTPAVSSTSTLTSSVAGAETAEGWKCSSCGAVNGSTATSCRMCFAPR